MSIFSENLKLIRAKSGFKQTEIAEILGVKAYNWSNYEVGRAEPDIDSLVKIANFFKVSIDSLCRSDLSAIVENLITGNLNLSSAHDKISKKGNGNGNPNGNLIVSEDSIPYGYPSMPKVITVDSSGNENITFVAVKARAGYLNGFGDPEFIQALPSYRIPGLNNGSYRCFEIEGHSMIPTFNESDRIIGRYVENFAEIRDNRIYTVITKRDGIVVKRVVNRISSDGKLILNSDNQRHPGEYPPIVLNPDEVLEMWYGVMFFSRQMREPGDLYNRITNLESRLTLIEQGHGK
jgi:transcriptional regulator with XRE-family HTH domain